MDNNGSPAGGKRRLIRDCRTVLRGTSVAPPRVSTEWTDEIMTEDTSVRECPHDDIGIRPRVGTIVRSSALGTLSRHMGEGCSPSPVLPGTFIR